jgi:carboxyl-terminal processing protease
MNNNQQKKLVQIVVGLIVLLLVFFAGSFVGKKSATEVSGGVPGGINVSDVQFQSFWKVWRLLSEKYVGATTTPQDAEKRVWGAIQGLTASQGDPYTVFFPPEESSMFKSDIAGTFEGIGMEIGVKDGAMTVVAPVKGSPADKADVRTGDILIKINDQSTKDMAVDSAVKLIRGPKGTPVKLTFTRAGVAAPIEKNITRATIDIPTLQTEVKNGSGSTATSSNSNALGLRSDGIYVIRLFTFTAQAPELFRTALRSFVESGSHKLIIDLRGNPGGYLEAAVDMASWFLPPGKLIVTEDFGGKASNQEYKSKGYNIFGKNLQLIILVDSGSASASEIFAGALKEHGVAKLVGVKTFGKGSVQELIPITPDTSLKVTIARWLTPSGHNLSHDGLDPDVEVKITQKDIDTKNDAQMNAAVDLLKKQP